MTTTDPNKYQLMPAYTDEQFAELKEDIRQHGVLQPIEFDTEGNLLDGHHRFRAFSELIAEGHDLPMFDRVTRQFDNEEDKIAHVLSLNVRRRHLTPPQISELCGKLRLPPFNYTLAKIGQVVGMSAVGVWSAIARLDQATRDQIDQEARIVGKDGSVQLAFKVAPRVFQTGQATLQAMQREAVAAIGAELLAAAAQEAPDTYANGATHGGDRVSGEAKAPYRSQTRQLLPSKPLVTGNEAGSYHCRRGPETYLSVRVVRRQVLTARLAAAAAATVQAFRGRVRRVGSSGDEPSTQPNRNLQRPRQGRGTFLSCDT
jgi:ParB-like chromosome segregation protein Spo0J